MKYLLSFFLLILGTQVFGQELDMEIKKLSPYIEALQNFSKNIPQEKVYLHFDNTSYYQNDKIWFKCYVTSGQRQLSLLSKTLYVELLNPGGEIVDKRILPIEDGVCHGDFTLNRLPFYSGFFEVRAYTKYMLNFDEDIIFSRLIPVFDIPKKEGNFEEKSMLNFTRWGIRNYTVIRKIEKKEKKLNLRFFPEGGNLVQGVASRVAFEATDEIGNPADVTGVVRDATDREVCRIITLHEGRGVFTYTPTDVDRRQRDIAEVEYAGKKYRFELPTALPQGVVMEVDHLSHTDSVGVTLRKNASTPAEILGIAVLNGGKLQNAFFSYVEEADFVFKIDKKQFSSGVSQIVLFNANGEVLCDRLVFIQMKEFLNNDLLHFKIKSGKSTYKPFEEVNMEISVTDKKANPLSAVFSFSVRDGENEVLHRQNILTDLLLMSEIRGFVRDPVYYFEKGDERALDELLMVQGWRRYPWKQMAGLEPIDIKYLPEQGIEIHGKVVSLVRQKPQPEVDVSMMLTKKREENAVGGDFIKSLVTDEQGGFSFVSDLPGRWSMILTVSEKGKKKDHLILLDRAFSPERKKYRYADMQVITAGKNNEPMGEEELAGQENDDSDLSLTANRDSMAGLGIDEKTHLLDEVTVIGKRNTKTRDILRNRSTSVAYYDVHTEMDNIFDQGEYIGNDLDRLLMKMNKHFTKSVFDKEKLLYKQQPPLFIINYKHASYNDPKFDSYIHQYLNIDAIKSVYINETRDIICHYAPKGVNIDCSGYSCVVFIETYEGKIPVSGAKGVRKTWLEGYSEVSEFYSPNYAILPPEPNDYRRTLYWNPTVTADENGNAKITFYNNSRCTNFSISAETVTPEGLIGVFANE
ncbi:hypothetical protein [Proteiniphilum sp.]|uniref:hypothetical protein n=1 Tax=Proteiniphilum sp. TaxID=1926877 RepID=UPI002B1FFA6D|nr:hypothetical protein [Proteiniphilum sp.]MEA4916191.1 hypothetical protein [Proteiniphilum sp.]